MRTMSLALRHELVGLGGVIERIIYLVKRYIWRDVAFFLWTVANTLTIVFIAEGIPATGGTINVRKVTTIPLIGGWGWADQRREGAHEPAERRRDLGLSRDHLRDPHRDRRLGALGGDDRVHVHGAPLASHAPRRVGRLRRPLRAGPRDPPVHRRGSLLRPRVRRRELHGRARDPDRRVRLVLRDRGEDGGAPADLAGEGGAARVRRTGDAAGGVGRLLPRRGAARMDAGGPRAVRLR